LGCDGKLGFKTKGSSGYDVTINKCEVPYIHDLVELHYHVLFVSSDIVTQEVNHNQYGR